MKDIDPTNKRFSAKKVSKISMIIAGIWIAILTLIKAFWALFPLDGEFGLTMNEIIMSGIALAAIFSPVYFSIFLDKIKEIKIGDNQ